MTAYRPLRASRVTNRFGARGSYASRSDSHGPAGHHTGEDLAGPIPGVSIEGAFLRSSTPGTVLISEYQRNSDGSSTMGNWVGVYYVADDVLLTYWHMKSRAVQYGDLVRAGQVIGRLGSTGNSTAPHVHIQANRGRSFDYHGHIDPKPWIGTPESPWAGGLAWVRAVREQRRERRASK